MSTIYVFPGQGSQKMGMGADLFKLFPDEVAAADAKLGYSIENLCMQDPGGQLNLTQFTQPALYVVNALTYLRKIKEGGKRPDFVAGHSLGEYNALLAAGVFDFITGLTLVQKRGEIMSRVSGGGMAAVIGLGVEQVREVLKGAQLDSIDIANLNSPMQVVIAGPKADVEKAQPAFENAKARMFVPLKVSGAFHSRYMKESQKEFETFLGSFTFAAPAIPVIANVTALPYESHRVKEMLSSQITSSVRWTESIQHLSKQAEPAFEEIGPGNVLTGLIRQIMKAKG